MRRVLGVVLFLFGMYTHAQDLVEFDYEIDAYYTNVSMFIDLDHDEVITDSSDMFEDEIYLNLIKNTFKPNIFLIEAAIHPMGIAGLYYRQNHEELYDRSKINEVNWIKPLTAGFEEPHSLSFFVGNMMVFQDKKTNEVGKNRAFMGWLVTIGDYTIKDNLAHWDRWVNIEYKLKGTREKFYRDLDWSFRVGSTIHENKDFVNNIYIGARRSSIDYFKDNDWSIIYNSAFSTMVAVSADTFYLTEAEFVLEKKWPLSWSDKISFGLGLGYLYNSGTKYRGALKDEGIDNHQLIFRPNFKW